MFACVRSGKGFAPVSRHSARFGEYVRSFTAEDVNRPVPDSGRTVGETVTHVQSVYECYTRDLRRAPTAEAVAGQNSADVGRIGVDPDASVASIE